jgi:hypothetical protein
MGQKSDGISRREWNTPVREPWNALIKECLSAVDRHNVGYFETGDARHLHLAAYLRSYVSELKDLLKELESTER